MTRIGWSPSTGWRNGFSMACLAASAADKRHRDHEVGGRKAEQNQDEPLALPAAEQILEHGDGPLPGVAAPGDLRVDRQGAEQRHEDEDDGRDRGHRACREQRDAGLVAEGREVVDARQPDDLPPGMGRGPVLGVVAHGLTAPQPLADGGSILERGLRQLFAKGDALLLAALGLGARRRGSFNRHEWWDDSARAHAARHNHGVGDAVTRTLQLADVGKKLIRARAEPFTAPSTLMGEFVRNDIGVWGQVAKAAGLRVQ